MIETVTDRNLEDVLPLIGQYQTFYQVPEISLEKNRKFFQQFVENSERGCQFCFRSENQVIGFATVYFTFTSTIAEKVAILNDLYTVPESRGQGVGRQLIEHSHKFAADRGAVRLQWVTAPENEVAQRLYDSMDTKKSTWHFYTYSAQGKLYQQDRSDDS